MTRLLVVEPRGGLANRLRVILTAAGLAEESGRELRVLWPLVANRVAAKMPELFQRYPQEIETVPTSARSIIQVRRGDRLPAVDPTCAEDILHVRTCYPLASPAQLKGAVSYLAGSPVVFQPLHDLTRAAAYRFHELFTPGVPIIRLMSGCRPEGCVGVHIRRGDNKWAAKASPLSLFERKLSGVKRSLWLSTDSFAVEAWFRTSGRYQYRRLSKSKVGASRGTTAIREALADLLLLSRTVRIVGSACSSFGPLAAAIGGIEFEMIGPEG